MIEFSHAYKVYPGPTHALKDINLKIEKGEFVYMTGPSGAGKTTLFRLLSAYDRPSSGHIEALGFDLANITAELIPLFRRHIGVVYQDFRLIKSKSIFENVALPLEVRNEREKHIRTRVAEVVDQVGLYHKLDHLPSQLSGGEQQRVAIARALVHKPGVLIADEPTGNLDPDLSREIVRLFDKINAQGTTVFIASHDHALVQSHGKRVIQIADGRVAGAT
jgi:cell division transport system ATP-binding protein